MSAVKISLVITLGFDKCLMGCSCFSKCFLYPKIMEYLRLPFVAIAVLVFLSVSSEFGNCLRADSLDAEERFALIVAAEVNKAVAVLEGLDEPVKGRYSEILEECFTQSLVLRFKLLELSLENRDKTERKAIKSRLVELAKTASVQANEILEGKDLKNARVYFKRLQKESSVYEKAAFSWHDLEKNLRSGEIENDKIAELKGGMVGAFIKYHRILSDPSSEIAGPGFSRKEKLDFAFNAIREDLKPLNAAAKSLLSKEHYSYYRIAVNETTRVTSFTVKTVRFTQRN